MFQIINIIMIIITFVTIKDTLGREHSYQVQMGQMPLMSLSVQRWKIAQNERSISYIAQSIRRGP